MTQFLAFAFLIAVAFGAPSDIRVQAEFDPLSNCVAVGTALGFTTWATSTFNGNTLTYVKEWSVDGGAVVPLTQPSCPATTNAVSQLECDFLPKPTFPAGASYVDYTASTQIYKSAGQNAIGGGTMRFWVIPTVTLTKTDATCAGNDGTIQFTVTAGWTGHAANTWTYSLNGGAPVAFSTASVTINGLAPNVYSVTVTNSEGSACVATSNQVTVGSPYIPTFTTTKTNPSCPGTSDGTIVVTVTNNGAAPGGTTYQYSKDGGVTWQSSNTFNSLAGGTYGIRVRAVGGCTAGTSSVILTPPVAPTWTVEYDCGLEKLVFGGAGVASLTEYNINGGPYAPIATSSGVLADSDTPYTIGVKYTTGSATCLDSKEVTVSCVHHCALSPGYWKNQGNWFNSPCQYFGTTTWCSWTYNDLLTVLPSSIDAGSRAKFIAGRQYVAFILTMYYYSDPNVDVRTYTVAQLVQLGVPKTVAEAAVALSSCSLTASEYSQYGAVLAVFNNHVVDGVYDENVECNPKISVTGCPSKRSLVQQLRLKK
jgi:hypothetical protein